MSRAGDDAERSDEEERRMSLVAAVGSLAFAHSWFPPDAD
ncbi:hypothetical protein MSIMFI_00993 [Mycobacterium simulans]|nr:hypothetical protein MSIMFI_00993 [Mycobacterium simulans]